MNSRHEPPRVVAAVTPEIRSRIRAVLPGCDLRFVHTGGELVRTLDEAPCDLLILGLQFDESSAAALVERVMSREETFPVVCVRGRPSARRENAIGVHNFIDLLEYPNDALGNARVQAMLERLLPH
jgi:hypothetical protein